MKLQPEFNQTTYDLPKTEFVYSLQYKFKDDATTSAVLDAFEKMGVPFPESGHEYMDGTEGMLVFLNLYGIVIRIEKKSDFVTSCVKPDRVYSPWVLQPIASIDAGEAIIEICPGCSLQKDPKKIDDLSVRLYVQKINLWDDQLSNLGCVPFKTSYFPNGIPVVIDRLAVEELTEDVAMVRFPLEKSRKMLEESLQAEKAQEKLYGPLRQAFDSAWPDTQKMKQFWALCLRYENEEKLVAGWNESQPLSDYKQEKAQKTAATYDCFRLRFSELTSVTPAVEAVSPLTPVSV